MRVTSPAFLGGCTNEEAVMNGGVLSTSVAERLATTATGAERHHKCCVLTLIYFPFVSHSAEHGHRHGGDKASVAAYVAAL